MLIFFISRLSTRPKLFALSWLLLLASCADTASGQETTVREVVQQTFLSKQLTPFLSRLGPNPFTFQYEELPMYNGRHLPKPEFDIVLKNRQVIKYNTRMGDEAASIPILIEQIIIARDSATVKLRIPKQGVIGQFHLGKDATNTWFVTKAFVVET